MARRYGKLKKNKNGSITIRCTIPPELSDDALELFEQGFKPTEWISEGIRSTKRKEGMVKT